MRKVWIIPIVATFVLAFRGVVHSGDSDTPRTRINKALQSGGGTAKISKFKALEATAEGKMREGEFIIEGAFRGPDQVRLAVNAKGLDGKTVAGIVIVINGELGWIKTPDERVGELPKRDLLGMKDLLYAVCLADLLMTLKSKDYSLHSLEKEESQEKDTVGIRVTHAKHKEVRLYFDLASGLLAKSMVKLNRRSRKEEWCECFFTEYKEYAGVKHFTRLKLRQGGETIMDFKIKELKLLEKMSPDVFAKPQ